MADNEIPYAKDPSGVVCLNAGGTLKLVCKLTDPTTTVPRKERVHGRNTMPRVYIPASAAEPIPYQVQIVVAGKTHVLASGAPTQPISLLLVIREDPALTPPVGPAKGVGGG